MNEMLLFSCFFLGAAGFAAERDLTQKSLSGEAFPKGSAHPAPPCELLLEPFSFDQRVQLGGNYSYCWISPDGNKSTRGSLGGVQATYEYRPLGSLYLGAAFSYRIGSTSNSVTTRKIQDFNPQGRIGYTFSKSELVNRLSLFTGLGGRYLAEKVTVGTASLILDYTEFYIPVGFSLEKRATTLFSIGCNFEWMPQIFPVVRLAPLTGAWWGLSYQLLNFFLEIPLKFSLEDDRYTFSINPFFETWRDGASTASTLTALTLSLPGNTYLFGGVNLNFGFSF